ncbi:hypothetical protein GCM10027030_31480 [Luteococcus sediminum]
MAENQTPGRREAAKAAKRARILAAAQAHLRSVGYESMTMAQVARDADVAIGTVFTYAATKAELLMMVTAERWSGQVPLVLAAPTHEDPVVAIRELVQPLVDTSTLEPQTCAAIARELLFGTDGPHQRSVVALVAELESAIAAVITRAQPTSHASAAARLVVAGGLMEVNRARTGKAGREALEQGLTEMITVAVHGAHP